ncbi:MAG: ECF transporter S component [Dorea sp.]|jgi:riboflavin transporter FmnP|nr:ECF transporter S component [Dorea sp.]
MNQLKETTNAAGKRVVQTGADVRMKVRTIAFVGLMGAVSAVLMLFRFPIPFMPPFMSFDLSGLMEMLGGFMFGPFAAVCIIIVKILLQLVIQGSFSLGTGELQNFILSSCYVLPTLFIYHRNKTKKTAAAGMAVSTVFVSVVAVITNLYLIIPFYAKLFGMTMEDIIGMCTAVNPAMKDAMTMALFGIVPFNLIKYGVTSVVTFIVYKRLSKFIKGVISR